MLAVVGYYTRKKNNAQFLHSVDKALLGARIPMLKRYKLLKQNRPVATGVIREQWQPKFLCPPKFCCAQKTFYYKHAMKTKILSFSK